MRDVRQNNKMNLKEYEEFFKENFQSVSLVAYRYIGDSAVVEDIVQESFISIWEKQLKIYRDPQDLKKYLFVTVRNRAISYLRKLKIKQVDLEFSFEIKQEEENKELYPQEELSIRISGAVQQLPPKCKEIFLLAYIEGMTYNAIAEKLSVSKNTIKTQMGIAYQILRRELRDVYRSVLLFITFSRLKKQIRMEKEANKNL